MDRQTYNKTQIPSDTNRHTHTHIWVWPASPPCDHRPRRPPHLAQPAPRPALLRRLLGNQCALLCSGSLPRPLHRLLLRVLRLALRLVGLAAGHGRVEKPARRDASTPRASRCAEMAAIRRHELAHVADGLRSSVRVPSFRKGDVNLLYIVPICADDLPWPN